jgi:hypothetical protein
MPNSHDITALTLRGIFNEVWGQWSVVCECDMAALEIENA